MHRRKFISLLSGAAVAWPLAARAQQQARRIGLLLGFAETDVRARVIRKIFQGELEKLGWIDGRNVRIDYHWADGDATTDQIRELAIDIVRSHPDVIVTQNTVHVETILRETRSIPIVFVAVADPVGSGLVSSLSHPGGNVTGFVTTEASLGGKWLELLKQIAPAITYAAAIFHPDTTPGAGRYYLPTFTHAAASLSVNPMVIPVYNSSDIEAAMAGLQGKPAGGLVIMPSTFTNAMANRKLIVGLAAKYRVPAIYPFRHWVTEGGLISYGVDGNDLWPRAAGYVDRILYGAKPQDLPVQLPIKFELCVNLRTAKALGLEVPAELITVSDETIE